MRLHSCALLRSQTVDGYEGNLWARRLTAIRHWHAGWQKHGEGDRIVEGRSVVRNWSAWDEVKTGAVLSYGVIFIQFLVALLYTPVMLRLLGPNEFGLYSLVSAVVGYLSLISFGFAGAYLRFYSQLRVTEDWRGVRRLNGLFLTVFSALGLFAALGGVALIVSADSVLGDAFTAKEVSTARVLFV